MANVAILKTPEARQAIGAIASAFGVGADKAAPVINSLANAVTQRMLRATLSRGGIADMVGLIADQDAGRAISADTGLAGPEVAQSGNHVLDVLIGSKHVSRGIAARTARDTGIDVETAKRLLPAVASMMVGGLQQEATPEITRLVNQTPALQPQQPLPIPGDNIPGVGRNAPSPRPSANPFDNLPDIIRRGGTRVPTGGSLEGIIRSILGSLLGNRNRGVFGTIIQAFILRWLANLARRFFSRIVLGR